MLMRYHHGERQVWQVVKVPSIEAEDHRHLHRDLETLKQERASTTTRIKGLLSRQGLRVTSLTKLPEQLEALRLWDGSPVPVWSKNPNAPFLRSLRANHRLLLALQSTALWPILTTSERQQLGWNDSWIGSNY
jgi:transposase